MEDKGLKSMMTEMEAGLVEAAAKLLQLAMTAAHAKATAEGSAVLEQLLSRSDLAPRLVVAASSAEVREVVVQVWLHGRDDGAPAARLFSISATAEVDTCH